MATDELIMQTQGLTSGGCHIFKDKTQGIALCGYTLDSQVETAPMEFNFKILECEGCKNAYWVELAKAWDNSSDEEKFKAFNEVSDIIMGKDL